MAKDKEITDKELLEIVDESKLGKGANISNLGTRHSTKSLKTNGKYSQKTSRKKVKE